MSFALMLVGYPQLTPNKLVSLIQSGRRKLRAIKYQGQRNIRLMRQESQMRALKNGNQSDVSVLHDFMATVARGLCISRPEIEQAVQMVVKCQNQVVILISIIV